MLNFKTYINEEIDSVKDIEKLTPISVEKEKQGNGGLNKYAYKINYDTEDTFVFRPYEITVYKKSNRLRLPEKTRFEVYVDVTRYDKETKYRGMFRKSFGVARGESQASREKIEKAREKAQKWFKKYLGVDLGKYDFLR